MTENSYHGNPNLKTVGYQHEFTAQQIQEILPEAVMGTDKLVVNYTDIHTLKIAALEKRIAELESKLNNL
jgi:hypothetical protein